jgi:prevent-host-death family protein
MKIVSSFDAKTHLSALLERVRKGEEVTITRHGTAVARLSPVTETSNKAPKAAAERIRALRKGVRLTGLTVQKLIKEGRRY